MIFAISVLSISLTSIPDSFATPQILMEKGVGNNLECEEKCYRPQTSYVAVNERIITTNLDILPHTISSGTLSDDKVGLIFETGLLPQSASFEISVDTAGEYPYFCMLHPWMKGTLNVVDFDTQDLKSGNVKIISEKLGVSEASVKPHLVDAFRLFVDNKNADVTVSDFITAVMWYENK